MLSNFSYRNFLILVLTAFAIVISARAASAMPIKEYKQNVEKVMAALDTMGAKGETESPYDQQIRNAETLNSIKTLMPLKSHVEWDGETYTVDNTWLHQDLQRLLEASASEQPNILMQTQEQLKALQERLTEIEKGADRIQNKADEKRRLDEILSRSEFKPPEKSESLWDQLIIRLIKWLASLFPKAKPIEPSSARAITEIAKYVVIVLALGVIAYALRMFLPTLRRDRSVKKKEKAEARIVLGERLDPEQSASSILAEAEALARTGDVRAAIRKAYIALLVELGERKVISLAQHMTNRDYVSSVRDRRSLYGKLIFLTDRFERHWYGLAAARESDWTEFRAGYAEALKE
jgi:hypothetical protein